MSGKPQHYLEEIDGAARGAVFVRKKIYYNLNSISRYVNDIVDRDRQEHLCILRL